MVERFFMDQYAALMKHEFDVNDEVLLAIKYHTTGRQQMTKTEKLVFYCRLYRAW